MAAWREGRGKVQIKENNRKPCYFVFPTDFFPFCCCPSTRVRDESDEDTSVARHDSPWPSFAAEGRTLVGVVVVMVLGSGGFAGEEAPYEERERTRLPPPYGRTRSTAAVAVVGGVGVDGCAAIGPTAKISCNLVFRCYFVGR